jgi:hypothetical protein
MNRKVTKTRSISAADDPKQPLYVRLYRLQERATGNRLRILQIVTQLDRARKVAAKDPEFASARALIQQLEKMLRLAQEVQQYNWADANRLWKELQ